MSLNLNKMLKGLRPVVLSEYKMVNSRVAQVVVSTTERTNSDVLWAAVQERLGNAVAVISGSFRWLDYDKTSCHGFVARVNPCVMLDGKNPVEAGFRMVASNMYLSDADQATWELKSGAAGQYMVRHGEDDLGELLEASRAGGVTGAPRMATIASATAQPTEFVAFVNSMGTATPSMDYGFCVGVEGDKFKLVCSGYAGPIAVRSNEVVSVHTLDNKEIAALYASASSKNKVSASSYDKEGSAAYYKKLYSYAPDYLKLVLKEIDEMAAM
jgi:hypothetical protein